MENQPVLPVPPTTPQNASGGAAADATHDRILAASLQLFMRRGIKSVSMDDIAAALGLSKKTLYKWFETKDQLVLACVTGHLALEQSNCARIVVEAVDAVHEIVLIMKWTKQEHADVHPGIFFEMRKYYPAAWEQWEAHKVRFILGQIEDNLRRGVAEGLYRADLDVPVVARLHLLQIEGALNPDLFPARQFQPTRVWQAADEYYLYAVTTPRGQELMRHYLGQR